MDTRRKLMPYHIWICPECREQVGHSPSWGLIPHVHEPAGSVPPVEIEVYAGANAVVAQRIYRHGTALASQVDKA